VADWTDLDETVQEIYAERLGVAAAGSSVRSGK
jgi:hypothetical protein